MHKHKAHPQDLISINNVLFPTTTSSERARITHNDINTEIHSWVGNYVIKIKNDEMLRERVSV